MPRDTTPTPYHSFARPEVWADWTAAWDYLVQTVDSHLLKTGPIANRPSNPPTGSWYYATDDAVLYRYTDGGSWVAIAGTSAFNHQNLTNNPHGVTATQAGALPLTGGTVTGDMGVTGTLSAGEMAGFSIDTAGSDTWYRLGTIPTDGGANVLGFVTETSRTGNQFEGGMEWFKVKRNSGTGPAAFGGWHYQVQDPDGRTGESSVEYVDNGNGTAEVYYKAGPYTRGRLHIFQTGYFDADFSKHGTTQPAGAVEVQKQFPVVGDVTVGGDLDLRGRGSVGGTLSASAPTADSHLTTRGWVNSNTAASADLSAHTANTTNPHSVTADQAGALPLTGGTVTGPTSFTSPVNLNGGTKTTNHAHRNLPSFVVNQDRTHIRFDWVAQASMVLDVHAQIATSAVGTRNYVHKRFYLATYQTAGEIYAQESYIPDAMNGGSGNYDVIGDFQPAGDGTTDLILPIDHSHTRNVTVNLEFLGNKPEFMDGITVQTGQPRGEMPPAQTPETAPGLPFTVQGDLSIEGTSATVNGNEVWTAGNLDPATTADLSAHTSNTTNPHSVTAAQVGALSLTGGTIDGSLTTTGDITPGGKFLGTQFSVRDLRDDGFNTDVDAPPSYYPIRSVHAAFGNDFPRHSGWAGALTVQGWNGGEYKLWQLYGSAHSTELGANDDFYLRTGKPTTDTWGTAQRIITDDGSGNVTIPGRASASDPTAPTNLTTRQWVEANMATATGLNDHTANTTNPHSVTAAQVGALPSTGGSVTGDVSVSGTVSAGNIDAPLDGLRRSQFAMNTRTFSLESGGTGAWWKIARISEGSTNKDSRFNVTVDGTGPYGSTAHQVKRAVFAARGTSKWMDVSVEGNIDAENRADVVTTRDPADGHRYLYIRANGFLSATLTVQHTSRFGQFEFEQVASSAGDTSTLIGTIETDSGTDNPSYDLGVGEIRSHGPILDRGNQVWHAGNLTPATSSDLSAHTSNTTNPHGVTTDQIGAATTADEYTTPKEVGTQKTTFSLTRAGDLIEPLGAVTPAPTSHPTIIHAGSAFANPLAEWYIYVMNYSEHRNYLYYSDNIEGPYTEYGVVLTPFDTAGGQAEGPSVLHVPERDQVFMYYHELRSGTDAGGYSTVQDTYLATAPSSGDGTSFTQYPDATNPKRILEGTQEGRWDDGNLHYATMRRVGGEYVCIYRATDREPNAVTFGYAISSNGLDWNRAKYPPAGGLLHDSWQPNRKSGLSRSFPSLFEFAGNLVVAWVQDGTAETRAITWNQMQNAQPDSWVTLTSHNLGEGDSIDVGPYTYIVADEFMYRIDWRNY